MHLYTHVRIKKKEKSSKWGRDLDQLHELAAVVVDELFSRTSGVGKLVHDSSSQLQNPNDSLSNDKINQIQLKTKVKHFGGLAPCPNKKKQPTIHCGTQKGIEF